MPVKAIIIGAGHRGNAYAEHARTHPSDITIVGVAEPHEKRRTNFAKKFGLNDENCVNTWEDVFTRGKWADAVIISSPDALHYGPAMAAIAAGYDILLEKPASPHPRECLDIAAAAKEKGVKVVVCHTMRYAPFTMRLKEILDSGVIGKIMSVVHNENVGHIHQSHSFVRGNWGNSVASSPMILAKSCHDLDFLQWLIGKKCISLSSYGALSYFNRANVPSDAPPRCTDGCTVDCIYDTRKLYMKEKGDWFRSAAAGYFNADDEAVEAALKTGPYGRCVYQCDNDVVDHQVVSMLFEEEITVIFSMCAFTPDISRSVKIMGTKGQIRAHTKQKAIQVTRFDTGEENLYDIVSEGGHGGGDTGIMQAFCGYVRGKDVPNISEAWISAQNHMLCFAAEESRLKGGERIILEDYIRAAASA